MDREKLRQQLINHEGLRLKPYRCTADKLTIGVGRNLEDRGITEDEAMVLLEHDIRKATAGARALFPTFEALCDARQRVLVDMCFNLGEAGLAKFHNMRAAVDLGDFERAAEEMLDSRWATQVGQRARRLAEMMRVGREQE